MLRPKSAKRAPARRPFLTEGAPTPRNIAPYGARLRANLDARDFGQAPMPPQWALDAAAEESLTAGYSRRKNPPCVVCGVMKSATGACFC